MQEAQHWLDAVGPKASSLPYKLILCPPFPFLPPIAWNITTKKYAISLGVQDVSPFPAGAYTGAVSARNLEGIGIEYALIGHSERRRYFHETIQEVANKVTQCLETKIIPIVCVDKEIIHAQANALQDDERKQVIVLYEPVGHIGTGEIEELSVVESLADQVHEAFGSFVRVLYGGSVDKKTQEQFLNSSKLAGFGMGSASLEAETFL